MKHTYSSNKEHESKLSRVIDTLETFAIPPNIDSDKDKIVN